MNKNIALIKKLLNSYLQQYNLTIDPVVEQPFFEAQGDLATNLAMVIAKRINKSIPETAQEIVDFLTLQNQSNLYFKKIEIKKPGFINFYLQDTQLQRVLLDVLNSNDQFGASSPKHFLYNLELVSANPTGYLHIGHARNAAIGDSTARILKFAGYSVITEYYVNDAGNQINILATTVYVNYLWLLNIEATMPEDCYKGDIYQGAAQELINKYQDQFKNVGFSDNKINDPKVHQLFREHSVQYFMKIIKAQLEQFRVHIDYYISEQAMYDNHLIEGALAIYRSKNAVYEENDATWLRTTDFGDDKDRVLIKSDGSYTYITPDLASHKDKVERTKADKLINFWGADHHGYIKRMQAGLSLFGFKSDLLEIDLIQMVRLIKDGAEFKMSKRKGTAIWLVDLIELLGVDSIRYMLCSKTPDSHMDLDIKLLEERSNKNPVFYAQYATARCASIIKQANQANLSFSNDLSLLNHPKELELLLIFDLFNNYVELSAKNRQPHLICDYIQTLAKKFHSYYNECKIIDVENLTLSSQRYTLIYCCLQVFKNAFQLLGLNVCEKM